MASWRRRATDAVAAVRGGYSGTFAAALEVAKQAKSGDVILAMLPDTGERYLSTFLFEGINEGTDVELADL